MCYDRSTWSWFAARVPGHIDEAQQAARRIAFFHPPKCGGTSVRKWLASAFARPAGLDPIAAEAAAHNIGVGAAREREAILAYFVERQDTRFICGHVAYSRRAFADHENEFDLITLLRNPLSRVLSRFYFESGRPVSISRSRASMRQNLPIDSGDIATITLSMLAECSGARSVGPLLRGGKTDKGHMGVP